MSSGWTGGLEPRRGMRLSTGEDEVALRVITTRRSTSRKHPVSGNEHGARYGVGAEHQKTLVGETKVGHSAVD
ncbi:MAG: hypothetical protein ACR2OE_10035 [Thermomicrobiales bacterium]